MRFPQFLTSYYLQSELKTIRNGDYVCTFFNCSYSYYYVSFLLIWRNSRLLTYLYKFTYLYTYILTELRIPSVRRCSKTLTANLSKTTLRELRRFFQGTFLIMIFVKRWLRPVKNEPHSDWSGNGTLNFIFMTYLFFVLRLISIEKNVL